MSELSRFEQDSKWPQLSAEHAELWEEEAERRLKRAEAFKRTGHPSADQEYDLAAYNARKSEWLQKLLPHPEVTGIRKENAGQWRVYLSRGSLARVGLRSMRVQVDGSHYRPVTCAEEVLLQPSEVEEPESTIEAYSAPKPRPAHTHPPRRTMREMLEERLSHDAMMQVMDLCRATSRSIESVVLSGIQKELRQHGMRGLV